MAKFKKKQEYDLQVENTQEILAEEMAGEPIDKNMFTQWDDSCTDMTASLNELRGRVSDSLLDETILSISSTRTLTARVKVKLER